MYRDDGVLPATQTRSCRAAEVVAGGGDLLVVVRSMGLHIHTLHTYLHAYIRTYVPAYLHSYSEDQKPHLQSKWIVKHLECMHNPTAGPTWQKP